MAKLKYYEKGCNVPLFIFTVAAIIGVWAIVDNGGEVISIIAGYMALVVALGVIAFVLIPRIRNYSKILKKGRIIKSKRKLDSTEQQIVENARILLGVFKIFFKKV